MSFLTPEILKGTDWQALERVVARLMSHCGWRNVSLVGRSGDKGADVIAIRNEKGVARSWVVQVKAITGGSYIGRGPIDEAVRALSVYGAQSIAVATNGNFTKSAEMRRDELLSAGYDVKLWNGVFLRGLIEKWPQYHSDKKVLYPYQESIVNELVGAFERGAKRAQFILATGLGKTVVAGNLTRKMFDKGFSNALVLCHSQDLALQLEKSFWPHLKSSETTSLFFDGMPPKKPVGVTFGLYQTMLRYLESIKPSQYELVIVDESHHALASGFTSCIEHLTPKFLVGMTATPWRGDGESLDRVFGSPVAKVSLVDGMTMGFLAQVDYRIFSDNIDWAGIKKLSSKKLSIRDLNKKLFIPQRDEAVITKIKSAVEEIDKPKILVFSPSVEHAENFSKMLRASKISSQNISGIDRVDRQKHLMDFSAGRLSSLVAVDLLNEGIDVPDVNVLVFMRATHSRRIFIQQLGRGLRITPSKRKVVVLDFVSDLRRLADVISMDHEAKTAKLAAEAIYLKKGFVKFEDERMGKFVDEWLKDVANLGDETEAYELQFPVVP